MPSFVLPDSPPIARVALDYSMATPASSSRWLRVVFLLAALPAAVTPFPSFTFNTSPADVAVEFVQMIVHRHNDSGWPLILIAAPFFGGIVISVWQIRLLVRSPATKSERLILLSLAAVSALMTVMFFAIGTGEMIREGRAPSSDFWATAAGPGVIIVALFLLAWLRRRASGENLVSIALSAAWLANAAICLIAFMREYDPGGWVTLVATPLLLFNVILLSFRPRL